MSATFHYFNGSKPTLGMGEGVIQIYIMVENYKIQILNGTAFALKMW
jgi:hypothetical protein